MTFTWCHLPHQWVYCVAPNNACLTAWSSVETWPYCWPDGARCWVSFDNIFPAEGRDWHGTDNVRRVLMMGSQPVRLWKHWSYMSGCGLSGTKHNSERTQTRLLLHIQKSVLSQRLLDHTKSTGMSSHWTAPLTRELTVPPSVQSGKWALQKALTVIRTSEWTWMHNSTLNKPISSSLPSVCCKVKQIQNQTKQIKNLPKYDDTIK